MMTGLTGFYQTFCKTQYKVLSASLSKKDTAWLNLIFTPKENTSLTSNEVNFLFNDETLEFLIKIWIKNLAEKEKDDYDKLFKNHAYKGDLFTKKPSTLTKTNQENPNLSVILKNFCKTVNKIDNITVTSTQAGSFPYPDSINSFPFIKFILDVVETSEDAEVTYIFLNAISNILKNEKNPKHIILFEQLTDKNAKSTLSIAVSTVITSLDTIKLLNAQIDSLLPPKTTNNIINNEETITTNSKNSVTFDSILHKLKTLDKFKVLWHILEENKQEVIKSPNELVERALDPEAVQKGIETIQLKIKMLKDCSLFALDISVYLEKFNKKKSFQNTQIQTAFDNKLNEIELDLEKFQNNPELPEIKKQLIVINNKKLGELFSSYETAKQVDKAIKVLKENYNLLRNDKDVDEDIINFHSKQFEKYEEMEKNVIWTDGNSQKNLQNQLQQLVNSFKEASEENIKIKKELSEKINSNFEKLEKDFNLSVIEKGMNEERKNKLIKQHNSIKEDIVKRPNDTLNLMERQSRNEDQNKLIEKIKVELKKHKKKLSGKYQENLSALEFPLKQFQEIENNDQPKEIDIVSYFNKKKDQINNEEEVNSENINTFNQLVEETSGALVSAKEINNHFEKYKEKFQQLTLVLATERDELIIDYFIKQHKTFLRNIKLCKNPTELNDSNKSLKQLVSEIDNALKLIQEIKENFKPLYELNIRTSSLSKDDEKILDSIMLEHENFDEDLIWSDVNNLEGINNQLKQIVNDTGTALNLIEEINSRKVNLEKNLGKLKTELGKNSKVETDLINGYEKANNDLKLAENLENLNTVNNKLGQLVYKTNFNLDLIEKNQKQKKKLEKLKFDQFNFKINELEEKLSNLAKENSEDLSSLFNKVDDIKEKAKASCILENKAVILDIIDGVSQIVNKKFQQLDNELDNQFIEFQKVENLHCFKKELSSVPLPKYVDNAESKVLLTEMCNKLDKKTQLKLIEEYKNTLNNLNDINLRRFSAANLIAPNKLKKFDDFVLEVKWSATRKSTDEYKSFINNASEKFNLSELKNDAAQFLSLEKQRIQTNKSISSSRTTAKVAAIENCISIIAQADTTDKVKECLRNLQSNRDYTQNRNIFHFFASASKKNIDEFLAKHFPDDAAISAGIKNN